MLTCSVIKFWRKIERDISVQKNYANDPLFSLSFRWKYDNICLTALKIVTFMNMVV